MLLVNQQQEDEKVGVWIRPGDVGGRTDKGLSRSLSPNWIVFAVPSVCA